MAVVGVLVFALALLLSIALHELGHLLTAKRFGMKASRYFIGMGPTLWSTWRGETEYGVKAFPVGGFVKIAGMTQLEDVDVADEPRAFWRFPAPQRAVVLAAGSAMHFLIALVVMYGALVGFGEPKQETTRVETVAACLDALDSGDCAGQPPAPAKVAGVQRGDRVVEFDGHQVTTWEPFTDLVRNHQEGPATLVVLRDGTRLTLHVQVRRVEITDDNGKTSVVGRIGLTNGETQHYSVVSAIPRTGGVFGELVTGTFAAMGKIPGQVPALFRQTAHPTKRTIDNGGPASVVDLGRFSGQAFAAGSFLAVLGLLASLNVFIGIFNLLPLLPLDGGHLAILGFEQVRSGIAKAFGRRDPGRVDLRKLMPATVAFIVVLGSLTLVLLYAGITNPIANPFKG